MDSTQPLVMFGAQKPSPMLLESVVLEMYTPTGLAATGDAGAIADTATTDVNRADAMHKDFFTGVTLIVTRIDYYCLPISAS